MENRSRIRLLTFLDQALSSLTNFGAAALAAGLLSAPDFGAFAVATSILVLVVGVARSWAGNSLMILAPTAARDTYDRMLSGAFGISVVIGGGSSVLVCGAALLLDGGLRTALLTLALCIPLVTSQDALRLGSLSRRDPRVACLNDAAWLITAVAGLMVLRRTDTMSISLAVAAAIGSAVVGVCVGLRLQPARLSHSLARDWMKLSTPTAARMNADFLIALSYSAVPLVVITAWQADLTAAGGLRTAAVLLGPLSVVYAGSTLYMQPRMTAVQHAPRDVRRLARSQSAWNTVIAIAWLGVALAIPDRIGVRVFGASWQDSQSVVALLGLAFVAMAVPIGPLTALRACGKLNANVLTQLGIAVSVLGATALCGLLVEDGMIRGFALGHVMSAPIAWFTLHHVWQLGTHRLDHAKATDAAG